MEEPGNTKTWTVPAIQDSVDTDPSLPYPDGVCGPKILANSFFPDYLFASLEDPLDPLFSNIEISYAGLLATEDDIGSHVIYYEVYI